MARNDILYFNKPEIELVLPESEFAPSSYKLKRVTIGFLNNKEIFEIDDDTRVELQLEKIKSA